MDVLNKWACNSILEARFTKFGPIDPHVHVLREVMNAATRESAVGIC